ncbi:MFS transporter [Pantoea coffeiphila]|uniref:MFS transporter n=1 Tax=Pantoea coffeiphila TaxID=1465635 RepID=UPI001FCF7D5D|nr:MFS transporter [Pantoea coffeiphila]
MVHDNTQRFPDFWVSQPVSAGARPEEFASAQAFFQTVSVLVMTVGGLAGALLTLNPAFATAPIATMFLGTALFTFPASLWMNKVGRKLGFIVGAFAGITGGGVASFAILNHSFALLCIGTFLIGAYQAFAQFYRFAASEVASSDYRPKAISLVMAGGIVAALAGPLLARIGSQMLPTLYLGSFILVGFVSLCGMLVLTKLAVPSDTTSHLSRSVARPWQSVVSQPAYLVALFSAASGYGIMILTMTATPPGNDAP